MKPTSTLQRLLYRSKSYVKRNSSTILLCLGAIGTVATTVLAVKATPTATQKCEALRKKRISENKEEPTKLDYVKECWKDYVPSASVGAATLTCMLGAGVLNQKQQASLISAYTMVDTAYREYKKKVKEQLGEEGETRVRDAIIRDKYDSEEHDELEDKQLYYIEKLGQYFESTAEDVVKAEYNLNRDFVINGGVCLNDFFKYLGVDPVEGGDAVGWSFEASSLFYGYAWIEFIHRIVELEDGLECRTIDFKYEPTADFLAPF